jgi:hypothetical protein
MEAYQLTVIWPVEAAESSGAAEFFQTEMVDRPFQKMRTQRMAYMDALVLNLAERTPDVARFVTWNAKHFKDKSPLVVLTPDEYLQQIA